MSGIRLDRKPGCRCERCEQARNAGIRARKLSPAQDFIHSIGPLTEHSRIRVIATIRGDQVLGRRLEVRAADGSWTPLAKAEGES